MSKKETFLIGKEIKNKPTKFYCLEIYSAKVSGITSGFLSLTPSNKSKRFNEDEHNAEWLQYKEKSHL